MPVETQTQDLLDSFVRVHPELLPNQMYIDCAKGLKKVLKKIFEEKVFEKEKFYFSLTMG